VKGSRGQGVEGGRWRLCFFFVFSYSLLSVSRAVAAFIWGTGRPGVGVAEFRMVETIVSALQSGWAPRKRAATPAARGAEALVPIA